MLTGEHDFIHFFVLILCVIVIQQGINWRVVFPYYLYFLRIKQQDVAEVFLDSCYSISISSY